MTRRIDRRRFIQTSLAISAVSAAGARFAIGRSAPRRPNIVFILADDLGYGDVACYGCKDIRTSVIDKLAGQGVRFTNFYANGPECTPTRTAFMTGRYQQRVGGLECAIGIGNVGRYDDAIRLRAKHQLGLPVSEISIARMLKEAGYTNGGFGKWHLGYEPQFSPLKHGFDYFFGPLGGTVEYFHHCEPDGTHMLYLNDKPEHRKGYLTDLITEESVAFIKRNRNRPFFLYVPYTAPHAPYQGPDDYTPTPVAAKDWNKGTRTTYVKMVERLDEGIGAILETLESAGVADNTLVVFASDNGAPKMGSNLPFSGYKSQLFEGGIRMPCIIRWPGVLPENKTADHMSIMMDLTVSFVRVAGAAPPPGRKFDGIDIIREIELGRPPRKRTLFWRAKRAERTWRAVRDGRMKYLSLTDGDKFQEYVFDLESDPREKNNLLAQAPDETARLKKLLAEWEKEVKAPR